MKVRIISKDGKRTAKTGLMNESDANNLIETLKRVKPNYNHTITKR